MRLDSDLVFQKPIGSQRHDKLLLLLPLAHRSDTTHRDGEPIAQTLEASDSESQLDRY
jgi:hypothetical protein